MPIEVSIFPNVEFDTSHCQAWSDQVLERFLPIVSLPVPTDGDR